MSACVTRLCLSGLAACHSGAVLARTRRGHLMVGTARPSSFPYILRQQPSATMETMTSSFPSSTRGQNSVQLDKIIFYSGPASTKTREITPTDADEWPDIDMVFAEDAQQHWAAGTEWWDAAGGFDITGEGEPCSQCPPSGLPSNARDQTSGMQSIQARQRRRLSPPKRMWRTSAHRYATLSTARAAEMRTEAGPQSLKNR
jgi:hypothetical protein